MVHATALLSSEYTFPRKKSCIKFFEVSLKRHLSFYKAFPQTNCKSDSGNVKLQKNDSQSF